MFAFPLPEEFLIFSDKSHKRKYSLEEMRKIDPSLIHLADEQLTKLRDSFYELASIACERWWVDKSGSKNPVRLFSESEPDDTLSKWKGSTKQE